MILIKHDKSFYSLHTKGITDASMEDGLYNKCNQYGVSEYELDIAIEQMVMNKHNAVFFGARNRFIFSYKLGEM